jgi:hypothetical protein
MKWEGDFATGRPVEDEIELLKQGNTWVPSLPSKRQAPPLAYPLGEHGNALTDSHLASLETIRETANPFDRAVGLVIRTAPFCVIWLALAVGLFMAMDGDLTLPFLLFCGLTALTYYLLNGQEYRHSAAGLERHKADLAHDLQVRRLEGDQAARDKALDSYIKMLEK